MMGRNDAHLVCDFANGGLVAHGTKKIEGVVPNSCISEMKGSTPLWREGGGVVAIQRGPGGAVAPGEVLSGPSWPPEGLSIVCEATVNFVMSASLLALSGGAQIMYV